MPKQQIIFIISFRYWKIVIILYWKLLYYLQENRKLFLPENYLIYWKIWIKNWTVYSQPLSKSSLSNLSFSKATQKMSLQKTTFVVRTQNARAFKWMFIGLTIRWMLNLWPSKVLRLLLHIELLNTDEYLQAYTN